MPAVEPALIEARQLSKLYARSAPASRRRLAGYSWRALLGLNAPPLGALQADEFWALRQLNFGVRRGEALGIVGQNGSGKTTLLRMLAGQILPDEGEIIVRGKSAAMIDLTAGFQASASGRENIFLRGAMLGRAREQMLGSMEEIIEFAELGDAIDAPVMSYSSGMTMRLAFSIMVAATPDVLLIDEVLAVGDMRFRQRCHAKMREIRQQSALVLVSHNMDDIATLCDHVIVLDKGVVTFEGKPEPALAHYRELMEGGRPASADVRLARALGEVIPPSPVLDQLVHEWTDGAGNPIGEVPAGAPLRFRISFHLKQPIRHLTIGVPVFTDDGTYLTGFASMVLGDNPLQARPGYNCFEIHIDACPFNAGIYHSVTGVRDGPGYLARVRNAPLVVTSKHHQAWGAITVAHTWHGNRSDRTPGAEESARETAIGLSSARS